MGAHIVDVLQNWNLVEIVELHQCLIAMQNTCDILSIMEEVHTIIGAEIKYFENVVASNVWRLHDSVPTFELCESLKIMLHLSDSVPECVDALTGKDSFVFQKAVNRGKCFISELQS